jgi:hypothetical protein
MMSDECRCHINVGMSQKSRSHGIQDLSLYANGNNPNQNNFSTIEKSEKSQYRKFPLDDSQLLSEIKLDDVLSMMIMMVLIVYCR